MHSMLMHMIPRNFSHDWCVIVLLTRAAAAAKGFAVLSEASAKFPWDNARRQCSRSAVAASARFDVAVCIQYCDEHAIGGYSYQAVPIAESAMLRVSNSGQKDDSYLRVASQQMQVALGWLSSK